MNLIFFLVFISSVKEFNCLYLKFNSSSFAKRNFTRVSISLKSIQDSDNLFPKEFSLNVSWSNRSLNYDFLQTQGSSNDVFTVNSKKIQKKEFLTNIQNYQIYKDEENGAVATIILNNDLHALDLALNQTYRILLSISNTQISTDIFPVVIVKDKKLISFQHVFDNEVTVVKSLNIYKSKNSRKRRLSDQVPLNLYVRYLVVIDNMVYQRYKNLYGQLTDALVLQFLKIYYSQIVNAIDLRFSNSLSGDSDLQLNIRFAGLVVFKNPADTPWTNSSLVAVPGYPNYNQQKTMLASTGLSYFSSSMSNKKLRIPYDHAVGITTLDMWSLSTFAHPGTRSATFGTAYQSAICSTLKKFSLVEDMGFGTIGASAKMLGMNLGAETDGSANSKDCPASDNFIMTPFTGMFLGLENSLKFSTCSIRQFKNVLSNMNGSVSNQAKCLANQPLLNFSPLQPNNSPPGALFSADDQCRMIMGSNSNHQSCALENDESICSSLYCTNSNGICVAISGQGAVDGTTCGTNQVCYQGACVISDLGIDESNNNTSCLNNPCLNGGTCITVSLFYLCQCIQNYTGFLCENPL